MVPMIQTEQLPFDSIGVAVAIPEQIPHVAVGVAKVIPAVAPPLAERLPLGTIGVTEAVPTVAMDLLDDLVHNGGGHYVCFCDANLFVHAQRNPDVAAALNNSSMTFPDGVMLVVMSRLLGRPLPQRLPGPSFMLAACEHGLAQGYRHFFYGGQEGVAQELAERLLTRFPGLIVAGTYTPPFRPLTASEEEDVRQSIEETQPDLLWVGLCEPMQSLWMASHVQTLDVPVMLGVGAAFDFHSGRIPWAPRWIRRIGMEWAYRSLTGGRRIFRRNLWCVSMSFLLMVREVWRVRVWQKIMPVTVREVAADRLPIVVDVAAPPDVVPELVWNAPAPRDIRYHASLPALIDINLTVLDEQLAGVPVDLRLQRVVVDDSGVYRRPPITGIP